MSRKHILDAIDASLRRLGTDYVDLYQLHGYDPHTPIDEALEALDTVVRSGKARYVGVSNWPAYKVARALGRSEVQEPRAHRLGAAALQPAVPQLRARPAGLCAPRKAIAVIPYNPLAGGLLTGKHDPQGAAGRGLALHSSATPARATRSATGTSASSRPSRRCARSPPRPGMTLATLAMRWVLSNPAITAPIIGASRPEQLADSLAAAEQGPLPRT